MPQTKSSPTRKRSSGSSCAMWRNPQSLSNFEKNFMRFAACGERKSIQPTTPAILELRAASWSKNKVSSSDCSACTAMVESIPLALRSGSRFSGRKSRFKMAISSVIQECRMAWYFQKCWCASIFMTKAQGILPLCPSSSWHFERDALSAPLQLLERDSPLPGNEIILRQDFRLGARLAASDLNHTVENDFAHLLDGCFPGDDRAGVDINDVRHAPGKAGVGRNFQNRRDGISRGGTQSRGEQHDVRACRHLRGHALDIVPRRALQIEAGLARILGIVQNRSDRRSAALFGRASRLHGVGEKAVTDISRRRIHLESGANGFRAGGVVPHELNESVRHFNSHAAVDQFLLHAAQFRKLRKNSSSAQHNEQIGRVPDGRIRGEAGKAVGAAALQAQRKVRQRRRLPLGFVRFDQTQKRFADGARNHRGLRRTLLLLENQQWLVEMGIAARDLLLQYGDLCILATQAENRGAGYVRMVDVTREQTAQIIGVLPRAPTAAFMHQEFDPVDISKHS